MIHFFQGVFSLNPFTLVTSAISLLSALSSEHRLQLKQQVSDGAEFRNVTVPLAWLLSSRTIPLSPLRHLTRAEVFYQQQISQQQSSSLCRAETNHKGNLFAFCKNLDNFVRAADTGLGSQGGKHNPDVPCAVAELYHLTCLIRVLDFAL